MAEMIIIRIQLSVGILLDVRQLDMPFICELRISAGGIIELILVLTIYSVFLIA